MNLQNAKIYHDGSHFIAIPQGAYPSGKGCKRRVVKPMQQHLSLTNLRPKPRKNALKRRIRKVNRYPSENAKHTSGNLWRQISRIKTS